MKIKIYLLLLLNIFVFRLSFSQTAKEALPQDTGFFNYAYWNGVADKRHYTPKERAEFITGQRKIFLDELTHQHSQLNDENLVWVSEPILKKGYSNNATNAGPCTNIDFEAGSFTGWTRSTGYNPLTNVTGCCPNPNGDQTIVSGAGLDPYGGFPIVYPGGGSFSLRLGSTATGGRADRISQTFFVTPANANFTYRYAAVLNDGGHNLAEQPRFTSEIIDSVGNPINCTFYQASAGSGVTGYSLSSAGAPGNNSPVIYKNWTNVAVDLTPNIGQNVTLRFTVYDCGPSGHFAYAYIDGLCTNFNTSVADTTCPNVPIAMCAPAGFSTTTWNGPGVVNDPNQCIQAVIPGVYVCTTLLSPGCPGPTFVHTLVTLPAPVVSFTPVTTNNCATQYTFNSSLSIAPGASVSNYTWTFGDGTGSSALNPTHNFPGPGTYAVKFRAVSNRGCVDSVVNYITVFPYPVVSFNPPSYCENTTVPFVNTSSISVGTVFNYTWTFGNGAPVSNQINPITIYTTSGTYTITLNAVSNQGCLASLTKTLGIYPAPVISFTANPLCDVNGTSFTALTSPTVNGGTLSIFNWDFGDNGTSTQASPVHIYMLPGPYTVSLTAWSVHSCSATTSRTLMISPSPSVAFNTFSINACSPNFTFANVSPGGAGPTSYTWDFGSGNTSTLTNPTHVFPSIGNYTVRLIGVSNSNGCGDTATQFISVYPYPIINFSVPASCENAIINVSTTAVSGSVTSYAWDFGDPASGAANTSTLQNPTHYYSSTNNYTLTLNIISNLNCPSSSTLPITVFPNPVAAFTYSTLNNCSLPFAFVNTSSVSNIGASVLTDYKWSFSSIGTTTVTQPGTQTFPGNGNYTVSLIATTNHNCSDTMISNILVHPLPYVDFTVTPVCLGSPVLVTTASSISPVPLNTSSITNYVWNYGDGTFTTTANPAPHTYTSSGTYTLNFTGISDKGCQSVVTHTLDVYPVPALDFTTTGNMCLGNPTQFTSTVSLSSGTIYAMNWDFGDNTRGSNQTTSHSYTTSGSYPVTFSVTTNNECTSVLTRTVTVHPIPVISFTPSNGCLNTLTYFNSTSSILTGSIASYNWNFGDGNSSNLQSATHTYTSYATFTPTLSATSDKGCVSTATNVLTIHPLPNIAFSPPGACVNTAIQFTNSSTIPTGSIASYIWDFNDGTPTVNVNAPVHTYTSPAVYVVTVTATSNQSCAVTATNNLTIYPYPSVSITPINSSCVNDMVYMYPNVTITGGNNPISGYTLNFGDGSPTFTTNSALQYTVPHLYTGYNTYTVTLSAMSNGCTSNTTTLVKVYPKPFANYVPSDFCFNSLTQFVNTSTIAATYSINAYEWHFGDGAVPPSTLQNTSHIFSAPGVFSVNLVALSYPEPGLTCSLSAMKTITINPTPIPSFTNNSVCQGVATTFTNTTPVSLPTQTVAGWSWFFYNTYPSNSALQNPSHTYTISGAHTAKLKVVNNFGCRDSVLQQVDVWSRPVVSFTANTACLKAQTNFTETTTITNTLVNSLASWSWNFGDNSSPSYSTTQNPNHTYGQFGTFTPTLTVTSNKGCVSSLTSSVTVHPLPVLSISPQNACVNTVIQFTNGSTIPLGSITSYTWNFNDGSALSQAVAPVHTYTMPSTYVVTVTATSNQGCVAALTNSLAIYPYPSITITPLSSSCVNEQVVISPNISVSGGNNAISGYTVNFGDGSPTYTTTTPLQYTVGHLYNSYNTYTLSISAISNGCTSSTLVPVNIYPKPFPNFTASKFCFKDLTTFVNTSTVAAGYSISGYSWDFDDGATSTSTLTSPTHSFTGLGVHNVSLTAFSNPEPSLTCSATAVKSITINPLPPQVSFTSNSVCLGNPTKFTNTTPTLNISGWSWFTNGQIFSINTDPSYVFPSSGKFPISLVALNRFGCRDTIRDSILVYANPTASFVTNNVCLGKQSLFLDKSTATDGSLTTYTWNTSGFPAFSNDQNAVYQYTVPGVYTVQMVVNTNLGCTGRYTSTLSIYPLPVVNFTAKPVCQNNPTPFTNLSTISAGSISSFLWTFDDPASGTNSISTVTHPTHSFPGSGSFATTLTALSDNNCSSAPKVLNAIVHANPKASFTNTLVCVGDQLSFANLSTSSDGLITNNYWDFNGDNIIDKDGKAPVYTYSLSGNFNVKLTVLTEFGCADTVSRGVFANPKAVAAISSDNKSGCPTLCVNFKNLSAIATGSFSTSWDFGDGSPPSKVLDPSHCFESGTYDIGLTLVSDVGCTTRFVHPGYVSVSPLPVAGFKVEPEEVDEDEPVITVSNLASKDANFVRYYINDGSSFGSPNFTHYIKNLKQTKPMIVQIVKNQYGCSDTISQVLNIRPAYVIYFPDAFTPNGDGKNDDFMPKGVGILKFSMQIFDRWGHQVFSTNDITDTWDGRSKNGDESIKQDTYTWKAQVTDVFNKNHFLIGKVTVIR